MKFLPVLRPVMLATALLSLSACETPSNRRELYNSTEPNGPWHDYTRRREAETDLGMAPGSTSITTTTAPITPGPRSERPTPQPRSGPLQADPTSLPSTNTPAPSSTTTTTVSPAAAPAPVQPGESSPSVAPANPSEQAPVPPPPAAPPATP